MGRAPWPAVTSGSRRSRKASRGRSRLAVWAWSPATICITLIYMGLICMILSPHGRELGVRGWFEVLLSVPREGWRTL